MAPSITVTIQVSLTSFTLICNTLQSWVLSPKSDDHMFPQESLASSATACTLATAQLPESATALTVVATLVYSIFLSCVVCKYVSSPSDFVAILKIHNGHIQKFVFRGNVFHNNIWLHIFRATFFQELANKSWGVCRSFTSASVRSQAIVYSLLYHLHWLWIHFPSWSTYRKFLCDLQKISILELISSITTFS